ncbi:MAG: hypothetical protein MPW15_25840 [Candidatus Manganitrophus sp.]|nr:hypothetical protein [Candidatus Manganitrophus sp.]
MPIERSGRWRPALSATASRGASGVENPNGTKVPVAFLFDSQGTVLPGWPQLSASGGCVLLPAPDANCFEAGTYNQNVGLADLDGDGKTDAIIGYDNAYVGLFHLNGLPFSHPFPQSTFLPRGPGLS